LVDPWPSLGFVIFTIAYDPRTKSYKRDELGSRLVRQQEFWFTVGITVLIIIPWVTVRRVPVKVSSPSGHASIIQPRQRPGLGRDGGGDGGGS